MGYERSPAYQPGQRTPHKISRSKIDMYMQCPRCFWLEARLKIKRPSSPPFRINSMIDELFKKEFDIHREGQTVHPLCETYGLKLVPFKHEKMDEWRDALRRGVQFLHEPTNLLVTGGVDDIWVDLETEELVVVDYKATAKNGEVSLDADWQIGYKRQIEVYQWLLRANGFKVKKTGYFVYTNGQLDANGFKDTLKFKTKIIDYDGDDKWVEPALHKMKDCLEGEMPAVGTAAMGGPCEYCLYGAERALNNLEYIQASQNVDDTLKKIVQTTKTFVDEAKKPRSFRR